MSMIRRWLYRRDAKIRAAVRDSGSYFMVSNPQWLIEQIAVWTSDRRYSKRQRLVAVDELLRRHNTGDDTQMSDRDVWEALETADEPV